ncbi:MAG: 2-phospho-L-lactate transferase CofD family protein [Patescibacteria group bacterium]
MICIRILFLTYLFRECKKQLLGKAKIIYIVNLMTKRGQTTGYKASNHILDIEYYLGRKVDFIVISNSELPDFAKKHYEQSLEKVVENDLEKLEAQGRVLIRGDYVLDEKFEKSQADKKK